MLCVKTKVLLCAAGSMTVCGGEESWLHKMTAYSEQEEGEVRVHCSVAQPGQWQDRCQGALGPACMSRSGVFCICEGCIST